MIKFKRKFIGPLIAAFALIGVMCAGLAMHASAASKPPVKAAVTASSSCSFFSDGATEGWSSYWGSSAPNNSLAMVFPGGFSAVGVSATPPAGTVVSYEVDAPASAVGKQLTPFEYNSSFQPQFGSAVTLVAGENTITQTLPVNAISLGLQADNWAGTAYLDSATCGSAPAPSPTPTTPTPTPTTPTPTPTQTTPTPPPTTPPPTGSVTVNNSGTASLDGGKYTLQGNEFNSGAALTLTSDGNPDFNITQSGVNVGTGGEPGAYPSTYRGCHWGSCTASDPFPLAVSSVEHAGTVTTTDHTTASGVAGKWDDAYDIWYDSAKNANPNNAGSSLEMMIWLDNAGGSSPAGSQVGTATIDGIPFQVWSNATGTGGTITYKAVTAQDNMTSLDLAPFAADATSRGDLPTSWFLNDVEAGNELWQGGQGLKQNSFSVCVNGSC